MLTCVQSDIVARRASLVPVSRSHASSDCAYFVMPRQYQAGLELQMNFPLDPIRTIWNRRGMKRRIDMEYEKTNHERISLGAAILHNASGVAVVIGFFILLTMFSVIV